MLKVIIFVVVSTGFTYVSRASLRLPRSHGFFRFFAWETILLLILLNLENWFRDPFSWRQLVSWFLLIASASLAMHGICLLRMIGKPEKGRDDEAPTIGFEKTTTLVSVGAYKYIRHPLYGSLLFLVWGIFLKDPSWLAGILAMAATFFLVATARVEEAENIRFFGPAYATYMKKTKMFIPFIF